MSDRAAIVGQSCVVCSQIWLAQGDWYGVLGAISWTAVALFILLRER